MYSSNKSLMPFIWSSVKPNLSFSTPLTSFNSSLKSSFLNLFSIVRVSDNSFLKFSFSISWVSLDISLSVSLFSNSFSLTASLMSSMDSGGTSRFSNILAAFSAFVSALISSIFFCCSVSGNFSTSSVWVSIFSSNCFSCSCAVASGEPGCASTLVPSSLASPLAPTASPVPTPSSSVVSSLASSSVSVSFS